MCVCVCVTVYVYAHIGQYNVTLMSLAATMSLSLLCTEGLNTPSPFLIPFRQQHPWLQHVSRHSVVLKLGMVQLMWKGRVCRCEGGLA